MAPAAATATAPQGGNAYSQRLNEQQVTALNAFFSPHQPKEGQLPLVTRVNAAARNLAEAILETCPAQSFDAPAAVQLVRQAAILAQEAILTQGAQLQTWPR